MCICIQRETVAVPSLLGVLEEGTVARVFFTFYEAACSTKEVSFPSVNDLFGKY